MWYSPPLVTSHFSIRIQTLIFSAAVLWILALIRIWSGLPLISRTQRAPGECDDRSASGNRNHRASDQGKPVGINSIKLRLHNVMRPLIAHLQHWTGTGNTWTLNPVGDTFKGVTAISWMIIMWMWDIKSQSIRLVSPDTTKAHGAN